MYLRVVVNYKFLPYLLVIFRLMYFINFWAIWVFVVVPFMGYTIALENIGRADFFSAIIISSFLLLFYPAIIYFSAKRNFYAKGKLSSTNVFEITPDKMIATATSRNAAFRWDDGTYILRELPNWVVFYKQVKKTKIPIEIIPKEAFTDNDFEELKKILAGQTHLEQHWL